MISTATTVDQPYLPRLSEEISDLCPEKDCLHRNCLSRSKEFLHHAIQTQKQGTGDLFPLLFVASRGVFCSPSILSPISLLGSIDRAEL